LKSWPVKWRGDQSGILDMNGNHSVNALSERAKVELKGILRADIGEEQIKLLNDDDLQQMGCFLLVLHTEAIKRKLTLNAMNNGAIPPSDEAGTLL
jgi:hypothetical protein